MGGGVPFAVWKSICPFPQAGANSRTGPLECSSERAEAGLTPAAAKSGDQPLSAPFFPKPLPRSWVRQSLAGVPGSLTEQLCGGLRGFLHPLGAPIAPCRPEQAPGNSLAPPPGHPPNRRVPGPLGGPRSLQAPPVALGCAWEGGPRCRPLIRIMGFRQRPPQCSFSLKQAVSPESPEGHTGWQAEARGREGTQFMSP